MTMVRVSKLKKEVARGGPFIRVYTVNYKIATSKYELSEYDFKLTNSKIQTPKIRTQNYELLNMNS